MPLCEPHPPRGSAAVRSLEEEPQGTDAWVSLATSGQGGPPPSLLLGFLAYLLRTRSAGPRAPGLCLQLAFEPWLVAGALPLVSAGRPAPGPWCWVVGGRCQPAAGRGGDTAGQAGGLAFLLSVDLAACRLAALPLLWSPGEGSSRLGLPSEGLEPLRVNARLSLLGCPAEGSAPTIGNTTLSSNELCLGFLICEMGVNTDPGPTGAELMALPLVSAGGSHCPWAEGLNPSCPVLPEDSH